ncbi:AimR family lysis-lysogeny pheromone receptor [Jeotgalibacillus marinus]|uniref:AimR family lysis-lysogeny pheromone receptor n=1 Tax=Jeotgalibacillus marinus TaxID=86667 RepID=A0ABV3Q5J9_9BACL
MRLVEIRDCILEDARGQRKIAREIGVSKTTVLNYLKFCEAGKPQISLNTILGLHFMYATEVDREERTIEYYAFSYELKPNHLKETLVYCYEKNYYDLHRSLVDKVKTTSVEMAKFSDIIWLMSQAKNDDIEWTEMYQKIGNIKSSLPHIQFLKRFSEAIYLLNYDTTEDERFRFKRLGLKCNELLEEIDSYKGMFPYKIFFMKVQELYARAFLKQKNYEMVRKIGHEVIKSDVGERHKASANYAIGMTYIYDDYERFTRYLEESIQLYKKIGPAVENEAVHFYLEFALIFHGQTENLQCTHSINKAYLLATQGRVEEARETLRIKDWDKYDAVFATIVRSLIEPTEMGREQLLDEARLIFENRGDYHFKDFPDLIFKKFNKEVLSK